MSQSELREQQGYLADQRRTAAYRAALAEVVGPDDVVLDLGAGTGLLGFLACEAGARSVVAVDRGEIVGLARRLAADNGYAGRITHVRGDSTEIDLDVPVDVVVSDQIGGLVHDAGILRYYADARRRLLAPGGRLVPASFEIFAVPVTFEPGRQAVEFWSSTPATIEAGAARALAVNTEWHYRNVASDALVLAPPAPLASFASDHDDPIAGCAEFEVDQPGRFDGFVGWFVARMSPSVTLTNDPWSPVRFDRWCNFYPVELAVDVAVGDRIVLDLDVRPRLEVVSWATTVTSGTGGTRSFRQSNFSGSFLTTDMVSELTSDEPVAAPNGELVRAVLDLVDGTRTRDEIVAALDHRVGAGFVSAVHLEAFVRRVLALAR